jgi:hypothetical protein
MPGVKFGLLLVGSFGEKVDVEIACMVYLQGPPSLTVNLTVNPSVYCNVAIRQIFQIPKCTDVSSHRDNLQSFRKQAIQNSCCSKRLEKSF